MSKRWKEFSGKTILKWGVLFAIIFGISLPATAEISYAANNYTVTVATGYLALRNAKAYDSKNEIGELYTGDTVEVTDSSGATYWTVYSPKFNKTGYVNRSYLACASDSKTVRVKSGYLALRNDKAYDTKNEIGKLYTGDTVYVANSKDSTYWLVYAPGLNKGGYVDKNYLENVSSGSSGQSRVVQVSKGYLALRTSKAYDASNEIGELYTGDTVQLVDTSDSTYWYVYSPKHGKNGYVNKNYLEGNSSDASFSKTVSVNKGYLALRTSKVYDESNEIGELYTGDTVQVLDTSDSTYWYVYSPKHGKNGYVNKDYLY